MTGGLIQLVTTGIQDSPLIGNPEITFFKTVYKQHTQFSICQNERYLGNLEFGKSSSKILEKNGDLLYNQYFKLKIPYFEIIKSFDKQQEVDLGYNINELNVTYGNSNCLIFYLSFNDSWYIVPEDLFKLSAFNEIIYLIDSYKLEQNLLPEYIKITNYGQHLKYYQIQDNKYSSIISILRIYSNFFEQFWLNFISTFNDINLFNNLVTVTGEYTSLYDKLKNQIFYLYRSKNFSARYLEYYDFSEYIEQNNSLEYIYKTETERYFDYFDNFERTINTISTYDMDTSYKYCIDNFLNFDDYKNNILTYNSKLILLIFNMLYGPSNLIFIFWKKYNILDKNDVNFNIKVLDNNFINDWQQNLTKFMFEITGSSQIKNQIYETIKNNYYTAEKQIGNLFNSLEFDYPKKLYYELKTIINRFYSIPNYQLNFNDHYLATKYQNDKVLSEYQNDNYAYCSNTEQLKYPNLISEYKKLDTENEMNNLIPIDLENIYGLISEKIIESSFNLIDLNRPLQSFYILWKNSIYNRLYKKYIDTYPLIKSNGALYDFTNDRKLSFYYSIYPSNLLSFDDYKQSFYEMLWKNSWIGNWNIEYNSLEKVKENIFNVQKYDLFDTKFEQGNKNFYKLSINNIYQYKYFTKLELLDNYNKTNFKIFNYDPTNDKIYIKFDNYYDKNCNVILQIQNYYIKYTSIKYEIIISEFDNKCLYLSFTGLSLSTISGDKTMSFSSIYTPANLNNIILSINITYETYVPILIFLENNIDPIQIDDTKTTQSTVIDGVFIIDDNKLYLGDTNHWKPLGSPLFPGKFIIKSNNLTYNDKFIKTLPDGTIVIVADNYPKIKSNKYWILNKFSNNEPNILNIVNNQIIIESFVSNPETIKLLTINYYSSIIKIPRPSKLSVSSLTTSNINIVTPGNHLYCVSYYTTDGETNVSDYVESTVEINQKVNIYNIPISENINIIGRKIYKTKANDNNFYLLVDIKNNTTTIYEDYISDDNLEFEYNIKNNALPSLKIFNQQTPIILDKTQKQLVKLIQDGPLYSLVDINNNNISLPTSYNDIYEIYIEEIILPFNLVSHNEYTINNNGQLILDFYEPEDKNKLMYLVNPINFKENYKLTCSKQTIPFSSSIINLNVNTVSGSGMAPNIYTYKISFYNNESYIESHPSDELSIILIGPNNSIIIKLDSSIYIDEYNSWKIYRNTPNILGNKGTFFHIATVYKNISNEFIDSQNDSIINIQSNEFSDPFFYLSRQINSQLINKPATNPIIEYIGVGNINIGKHLYKVSYYNWNTEEETFASGDSVIILNTLSKVSVTIPISSDLQVTSRRIYRTTIIGNYYLLIEIKDNTTTYFQDNINDDTLRNNLFLSTIERPNVKPRLKDIVPGNILSGIYKYKITYINISESFIVSEETNSSILNKIELSSDSNVLVTVPISHDFRVTGRNIYRTKANGTIFYLLNTILDNTTILYTDSIRDTDLSSLVLNNEIKKGITYQIMKVPIENVVPNLYNFISHSTDINFTNNKKMSDLNDFMFNKPFAILGNNSSFNNFSNFYDAKKSITSSNIIFYNLPFQIISTSTITLNDDEVNFLIPISTQQFFIKELDTVDPYYKNDFINNTTIICDSNEIIQRRFNPAFDEFNFTSKFLNKGYYRDFFVDQTISIINDVLDKNPDYKKVIELIDNTNKIYLETFTNLLNVSNTALYGSTTRNILSNIPNINNLNTIFNNKTINYDILTYTNLDYIKYSHYALRLYENVFFTTDKDLIKLNDITNVLYVLTPIWEYYDANMKISHDLIDYLKNIPNFFTQHITYVNNNINYLNISNANNYKQQYLSFNEIQQHKFNNFYDFSGNNTISLLHPIIDEDIYKINIFDSSNQQTTTIDKFTLDDLDKTNFTTTQFTKSIQKNNYYDAKYLMENRNQQQTNKFNYMGLSNVNSHHKFVYDDHFIPKICSTYYKIDDGKIIKGQYQASSGRFNIGISQIENKSDIPDILCINPLEIMFSDFDSIKLTITGLFNIIETTDIKYIYKVKINTDLLVITTTDSNGIPNYIDTIGKYIIDTTTNILYQSTDTEWIPQKLKSFYISTYSKYYITNGYGILVELNLETNFLINNKIISGFYKQESVSFGYLYIISDYSLIFNSNDFILLSNNLDYTSWVIIPNIKNYIIEIFKQVNFKSSLTSLYSHKYFKFANKYFEFSSNTVIFDIEGFSQNGTYFYLDSTALASYISIIVNIGDSTSIPTTEQLNTYINDTNKLYVGVSGNPNTWNLVKDKRFLILNDPTYNQSYCKIEFDGTIKTEINTSIYPAETQIYLIKNLSDTFLTIFADEGNHLMNIVEEGKYIIDTNKLYIGFNSSWILVSSGYYIISSQLTYYDSQLVRTDSSGNIIIFEEISIFESDLEPPIESNGSYYINSSNNSLYISDGITWKLVKWGYFLIKSSGTYFNKKIKTEFNGNITIINEIEANTGLINDSIIIGNYLIQDDKLYLGTINGWIVVTNGVYIIKSNILIYNNKCIEPDQYGYLSFVNLRNISLTENKLTLLILNNQIYSYFKNYEFSKQIREISDDSYILLIDLTKQQNRHFIFEKKNMINFEIPEGAYHSWTLPKNYLNFINYDVDLDIDINGNINFNNIPNIPTYSYYQISNNLNRSIYYYQKGSTINVSDFINYYQIKDIKSIKQIQMIDNKLFNIDMKQLINIYKNVDASENFITKTLTKNITENDLNFDSIEQLSYNSQFIKNNYGIKFWNKQYAELLGENEILVNMILKVQSNNHVIYHPIIVKKYENFTIPKVSFDYNGTNYIKSFVIIDNTLLSYSNQTRLSSDYIIGSIKGNDLSNTFYSLNPYLEINNSNLIIKTGFNIMSTSFGLHLWKIKGVNETTSESFIFYFWTLFIDPTTTLAQDYLSLLTISELNNNGISEPFYLSTSNPILNYGSTHDIITCTPNILKQTNQNYELILDDTVTRKISYKYWINTRHFDTINNNHEVLDVDYNQILNIKPFIENFANTLPTGNLVKLINLSNVYLKSNIYIICYLDKLTGNKLMYVNTNSELSELTLNVTNLYASVDIQYLSLYYSQNYPQFVSNYITLSNISQDVFQISYYHKLYLEMGEIIAVDGNYFHVNGLDVFNNSYELKLIRPGKDLRYSYTGYYTFGNYLRDDNRIIPPLDYQNTIKLYTSIDITPGVMYYDNYSSQLSLLDNSSTLTNINVFDELSLKVKLIYNNGRLFLFDNFIKLKILDKLVYNGVNPARIYQIINIRDNEILLDNTFGDISLSNNSFIEFILPYQPFEPKYILINNDGTILSEEFKDNQTLVFDIYFEKYITPITSTNTNFTIGTYLIDSNKLFIRTILNLWEPVRFGVYYIHNSNTLYDNNYYKLSSDNTLILFKSIVTNYGDLTSIPSNSDSYIINNNKLYKSDITTWVLVTTGYYHIIISDIPNYNNILVTIDKNNLILINNNIYQINQNKINVEQSFIKDYYWVRLWKTNYISYFKNYMYLPKNKILSSIVLKNNYPINIDIEFDYNNSRFKLLTDKSILNLYNFYYLQPVKYKGTYNYIKSIIIEENNTYIYLTNKIILNTNEKSLSLIVSPQFNNQYEYYSNLKFKYNFSLQPVFYNTIKKGDRYPVIRYILKNNKLIFIQKYDSKNQLITFEYGRTVIENEVTNLINDNYECIYFYEFSVVNPDGTFNNCDTLIGSWHLHTELYKDKNLTVLCKIEYPNLIKSYSYTDNLNYPDYIDRLIGFKFNIFNEFIYVALSVIQSKNMIETNTNTVEIIKKYDIKLIGLPTVITTTTWTLQSSYYYNSSLNLSSSVQNDVYIIDTNKLYLGTDNQWIQQINGTYNSTLTLTDPAISNIYINDGNQIYLGITTELWSQEISFFSTSPTFDYNLYNQVYLNESYQIPYTIFVSSNKFYINSSKYISNQIQTIYTKNINYLVSAIRTKTIKSEYMEDKKNEFYISTRIINTEALEMNIYVSVSNLEELSYKYKLIDNSTNFSLNILNTYFINDLNNTIKLIDNNTKTFVSNNIIDIDITQISKEYYNMNLSLSNSLNLDNIVDPIKLFHNIKQLRVKLIENSQIKDTDIFNYLKPWKSWSILNAVNKVTNLKNNIVKQIYLEWNNNKVIEILSSGNYLTNNEIIILSQFLKTVNNEPIALINYNIMKTTVEPIIFNNLFNWLNNPDFFMDVLNNINLFLSSIQIETGYPIYFDGNNIIFGNDTQPTYIIIDDVNEIASYITNEFTFDLVTNTIIRNSTEFIKIEEQINNWINKIYSFDYNIRRFGISVHKLLRYLVKLGDQLKELIDYFVQPFKNTPEYIYNNPLKFLINKIWEKYQDIEPLNKLDKYFNKTLTINYDLEKISIGMFDILTNTVGINSQIIGGIIYLENLTINELGIFLRESYQDFYLFINTQFNLSNFFKYDPNLLKPIYINTNLITKPIYPYIINLQNYKLSTTSTYSIDFLNGTKIASDIQIIDPIIYPDQLNFYSEYNIKPTDFIVVKENTSYQIVSTQVLGHAFVLNFQNLETYTGTLNVYFIDKIQFRNYNLNIANIDPTNSIVVALFPITNQENNEFKPLNYNDLLELRNELTIKKINYVNGRQYIEFYNSKSLDANFILDKTLLKTSLMSYSLKKDLNKYYVEGSIIDISEYNVTIIILVNAKMIIDLREVYYLYILYPSISNILYKPDNTNIIIPLEFKLVNPITQQEITPTSVNTVSDNILIFHYSLEDYAIINNGGFWNNIKHTKRLDQTLSNKIEEIKLYNEYLYYFQMVLPKVNESSNQFIISSSTTIYVYDDSISDINIKDGIWEPTIDTNNKISLYINQNNNITYFTISKDYTYLDFVSNIKFIQKNNWNISDINDLTDKDIKLGNPYYKYNGNSISIRIPNDFIYKNESKYHYKFNNQILDNTQFIFSNYLLTFDWLFGPINGIISFQQYYIEINTGLLNIPNQNRKTEITLNYPYQYKSTDHFYINPYSGSGDEFAEFLYLLETKDKTHLPYSTFSSNFSFINIYLNSENGTIYQGKVFDQYYKSNKIYWIFSLDKIIDLTLTYTYYLDDNINKEVVSIEHYQDSLQYADFYYQEIPNKIILFVNKSLHEYNYINLPYQFITAPAFSTPPELAPYGNFYIDLLHNNLFVSIGFMWFLMTAGLFFVTSTNVKYDNKHISILNDGTIIFNTYESKPNKFYLISYLNYNVTNVFNQDKFIQNKSMKKQITTTTITTKTTEIPKWSNPSRLINYIKLFFNDQLMEELNENTYLINYYLYQNENSRKQINNLIKFRFNNNYWELYIPLAFWFNKKIGLAIPVIALPHTEIRLEYKLNKLPYILDNDLTGNYTFSFHNDYNNDKIPHIKTTLMNEFILLDTFERKLFGSFSHEYIIERNISYPKNYIYNEMTILPVKFNGLIKDIYLITRLKSNPKITFIPQQYIKKDKRDIRYKRYVTAIQYYNLFMINNIYTSDDQRDYANDIEIIYYNNLLLEEYMKAFDKNISKYDDINNIITFFSNFKQWDNNFDFAKFLLYYQKIFLSAFTSHNKINYLITIYIQHQYNTELIYEEISFIDTIKIKANGTNLFSERDSSFFSDLIPVTKFKNNLPIGFYVYTFSLYPLEDQHSGHLNFTNFDDIVFKIKSNSLIINGINGPYPYEIYTHIKEYNILRIMSGLGSMAWIN